MSQSFSFAMFLINWITNVMFARVVDSRHIKSHAHHFGRYWWISKHKKRTDSLMLTSIVSFELNISILPDDDSTDLLVIFFLTFLLHYFWKTNGSTKYGTSGEISNDSEILARRCTIWCTMIMKSSAIVALRWDYDIKNDQRVVCSCFPCVWYTRNDDHCVQNCLSWVQRPQLDDELVSTCEQYWYETSELFLFFDTE